MKITVGIPVFNRVNTIVNCIESVLFQKTDTDVDILVVDNCSNDGTKDLLQGYGNNEKINILYNTENVGLANNWSKVFKKANGDFIYLLHSDDIMLPGTLEAVAQFLTSYPLVDFAFGNVNVSRNGKLQKNVFKKRKGTGYLDNKWLLKEFYFKGVHPSPPQTWILKKGIVEQMGGFINNNICCDFNMSFKIVASNFKVGYINKSLAVWVLNGDNIGGGEMEKHRVDLIAAVKDVRNNAEIMSIPPESLNNIENYIGKRRVLELLKAGRNKKALKLGLPKMLRPLLSPIDFFICLFFISRINFIKPIFKLKLMARPVFCL